MAETINCPHCLRIFTTINHRNDHLRYKCCKALKAACEHPEFKEESGRFYCVLCNFRRKPLKYVNPNIRIKREKRELAMRLDGNIQKEIAALEKLLDVFTTAEQYRITKDKILLLEGLYK